MRSRLLFLVFVLSGAAGLVFEVVLQRELSRVFGVSAFAAATVLAAYMVGLSLGAWATGRLAERLGRRAALALYAGLELGIAGCAVALPGLTRAALGLFVTFAAGQESDASAVVLARVLLAFAVTLVPTLLMGGTLPVLAAALGRPGAASLPRLYLANLLGAAVGAAAATYAALPALGLSGTLWAGAGANLLAALGALALRGRPEAVEPREPVAAAEVDASPPWPRAAWGWAAWCGAAAFVAEVVWTHLLAVVVGNSAYAFGLMLTVFLLGLALGARRASLVTAGAARSAFGVAQLVAGGLMALTLPLWSAAPGLFVLAGPKVTSWAGRELVRALVCVELVLLPAAALGLGYPALLRWAAATGAPARRTGQLGAVNTLGAVTGALGAGFGLLPGLGSRHALELLAVGCAAVGAWALEGRRRLWALVVPVVVLAAPPWNLARLASGANVYFRDAYEGARLVWAAESPASGLTSVVELPDGVKVLLTNGKFQGATAGELDAQRGIAQAPLLVAKGFERALHIGVGTGCTASFVAEQPFTEVDAVELSADILEAARRYFGPVNQGVFDSPRLRWHLADGRNALLLSPHRYDVIGLELSSIWFAGAADLYHRDFYALAKAHLQPGGVVQQWVQLHHLRRESLAVILASVRAELPHVLLLEHGGQGIILASDAPLTVNVAHLDALGAQLSGARTMEGLEQGELLSMLSWVVLDEAGVAALAAEAPTVSTDDNVYLEYATPKGNADTDASAAALVAQLRQAHPVVPVEDAAAEAVERARRWLERPAPE